MSNPDAMVKVVMGDDDATPKSSSRFEFRKNSVSTFEVVSSDVDVVADVVVDTVVVVVVVVGEVFVVGFGVVIGTRRGVVVDDKMVGLAAAIGSTFSVTRIGFRRSSFRDPSSAVRSLVASALLFSCRSSEPFWSGLTVVCRPTPTLTDGLTPEATSR